MALIMISSFISPKRREAMKLAQSKLGFLEAKGNMSTVLPQKA